MINKFLIFALSFSLFTIQSAYTQQIKVPPKKTESTDKKPVVKTSTPEQSTANKLTLKINPNLSCKLLIDGEDKGIITADGIKKVYLNKGTYLIQAISTENNADKFTAEYPVTEVNIEKLYKIDLIKIKDIRLEKAQAEAEAKIKAETKANADAKAKAEKEILKNLKTFTDPRNSKSYKIVTVGTQTWMAENLAYKAENGCWAYNDDEKNVTKYGYLYNWETAQKICPGHWHLPSETEWTTLITFLGGEDVAGGKLKSTTGWNNPNDSATDGVGFSALPGGDRQGSSSYDIGKRGFWWSSTQDRLSNAWNWELSYNYGKISKFSSNKYFGFSVRCIKD